MAVQKEIRTLDKARERIVLESFEGTLTDEQASMKLQGLLVAIDVIDASKAPVLKEQAAKLRQKIDANITKITGVEFVSAPPEVDEDEDEESTDTEAAATAE